jgi:hypothetical protein
MTWQESLRQLDARLANGEISANEYRKSRDEILAEASSGSSPQPPEDLWVSTPPPVAEENDAASGETTIVVKMNQADEEPTQVVPAAVIAPTQPPWTGGPMPPNARQGVAPPVQERDVFAVVPKKRGGGLVRFLVPLLILAVVGGGVWWFVSRDDDGNAAAEPPPSSTATAPPSSDEIAGKLPELPGNANTNNGTLSVDRAQGLQLFTPNYAKLLADNGASEIVYRGAVRPGFAYMLVATPVDDAATTVELTTAHLKNAGFAADESISPDGPPVITRTDQVFRTYIAIYSAGDVWIQLNISAPPNGDENALRTEFENVLGSLTERLPAD